MQSHCQTGNEIRPGFRKGESGGSFTGKYRQNRKVNPPEALMPCAGCPYQISYF